MLLIATLVKTGEAPVVETAAIPAAAFVTPLKPGDVLTVFLVIYSYVSQSFGS